MADAIKLWEKHRQQTVVCNIAETPSDIIESFDKAERLFIDTETTAFHPWRNGEIALVQIHDRDSGRTLLGRVNEHQAPPQWLKDQFRAGKTMVGHNLANFDNIFFNDWGLPWDRASYYDTLIAETVLATSDRRDVSKSLRESVRRRTGLVVNKDIEHGHWRAPQLRDDQVAYAAIDVLSLPELMDEQISKGEENGAIQAINVEMEVLPVFSKMTINGLPISRANLAEYMQQSEDKYKAAEVLLRERLGVINYQSIPQLKKGLRALGIDLESTAKDVLLDLIEFDPEAENSKLFQAILDWRAPHKRTEMYGSEEWQMEHIQPDDRVHAKFWQCGAVTTRVAGADPNLQQVPKDGRWIFGGLPGYKIVAVDYSQLEIRIAAHVSQDLTLMDTLEHEDVHRAIASQVFQIPVETVTARQRKMAKALVFTLLFGGGIERLYNYARLSGSKMTMEEATDVFYRFFDTFQGLKATRAKAKVLCKTRRVVVITLPSGARRVLAGKALTPSTILNTPVQGSAAVGFKLGLIEANKRGLSKYIGAVVHDETVSAVPDNEAEDYAVEMSESLIMGMEKIITSCPIRTGTGRNKDGSLPDVWLP